MTLINSPESNSHIQNGFDYTFNLKNKQKESKIENFNNMLFHRIKISSLVSRFSLPLLKTTINKTEKKTPTLFFEKLPSLSDLGLTREQLDLKRMIQKKDPFSLLQNSEKNKKKFTVCKLLPYGDARSFLYPPFPGGDHLEQAAFNKWFEKFTSLISLREIVSSEEPNASSPFFPRLYLPFDRIPQND